MILGLFAKDLVQLISGSQEAVVLNNGALYLQVVGPFYAVAGGAFGNAVCPAGLRRKNDSAGFQCDRAGG